MSINETIAAVSTPRGKGGIAVIRISGPQAFTIADRCFQPQNGKILSQCRSHQMVYGSILKNGNEIDDGYAVCFQAPHSYTGEDTVELNCHGGMLITQMVLESVLASGAVPAMAGEFTKRAFINGKLSLSQAEAIGFILDAESEAQAKLALLQSKGLLSRHLQSISEELKQILSSVYVYIDYPDEDLSDMKTEDIRKSLLDIKKRLHELSDSYDYGKAVFEGVYTVIVGLPNTGKSSLLNMLLKEDRAIVTDIAGTTRDTIEENLSVGSILLRLCDTAGLRDSKDIVEAEGIRRSKEKIQKAELVLAVIDASHFPNEEESNFIKQMAELQKERNVIAIFNKSDLGLNEKIDSFRQLFSYSVILSAKEGSGEEDLKKQILEIYDHEDLANKKDYSILINAKQHAAVSAAEDLVSQAISSLESGFSSDIAGLDIELALGKILELDSREVSEEIVNEIFSKFCVGK